jgi:DNA repair protein RadA/Sms
MPKTKSVYTCTKCDYQTPRWLGKCPECNSFNTLEEEIIEKTKNSAKKSLASVTVSKLNSLESSSEIRTPTKIEELDRVLSGGIVEGSLILVGGDPGIGKSTILLQICESIGNQNKKILYISGEESRQQIKLRSERLDIKTENLYLMSETNIDVIEQAVKELKPNLLIIDSIQTMYREEVTSSPGSVTQVRECTSLFMKIAKGLNISVILVGHVTKEGAIAGPKMLEHMVDTVLYFEGEKKESYRIIRAVKNRFGSTNEIGVFEMREKGLFEIKNPSEYMLSGRPIGVSGSTVTCSIEGTRPILVEVQALVSYTNFGIARRMATGMDYNRVTMLIAVLEKRQGYKLGTYDSYVNIAGGMKIVEPALDASAILAIASSFKDKVVDPYTLVFGEVGLAGEMRAVTMAEKRVAEAEKLGFKHCILPQANMKGLKKPDKIRVFGASNISEMLELCFN